MTRPATAVRETVAYGTFPLIALASTQFVHAGEMQSLGFAVDGIQKAFGVSNFEVALIPIAMAVVGIAGAVPFGILADRRRRTLLLALGTLIWTAAMGLTGLATSFGFLLLARMAVGALEATSPAAVSLICDYWPVQKRAARMGLYQLGSFCGAIAAFGLGGVAVSLGGWRWAFFMWMPIGLVAAVLLMLAPEPERGRQDEAMKPPDVPPLARVGTGDYYTMGVREAFRAVLRIRSMWCALVAIAVAQMLLSGLGFWAVTYFKRVHHLGDVGAGGLVGGLAVGSAAGIIGGGYLADRLLRNGIVFGRINIIATASILASLVLMPAFASTSLWVTAPLFVLGGCLLTLPIAPAEALMSEVVVCDLRGRAATLRTVVRTLSSAGPAVIGALSDGIGLRWALVAFMPVYALSGLIVLLARRTYEHDLAFVVAETHRTAIYREERASAPSQ
jgi:MFS family permease